MALSVYLNNNYVGQLWLDERRRFLFQYEQQWLQSPHAIPISLSLALREEIYDNDLARPFFTNLLPEARLKEGIARKLGISEQNDYALLQAVGGECAGAVSLSPQGSQPNTQGHYQPLTEDELHTLIQQLPQRPMLAGEGPLRLSLAGVQNKLPVYFDGHRISLPNGALASSHILKPVISEYQSSVMNEAYCMHLAQAIGLPVPKVTLLNNQGQWLYLVSRYDRERDQNGTIIRQHQEDFCQALGILPEIKYEKEGGPSLADCFRLTREQSIQPLIDLRQLLNWVVFNYLIGNADAHGKNVSLLLTQQGPRLAPFYDLMSTAIYPGLTDKPAMKIGGEDRPKWIIASSWQKFAEESEIGFKLVKQTLEKMSANLAQQALQLAEHFSHEYEEDDVPDKIQQVIRQRGEKIVNSFNAANL